MEKLFIPKYCDRSSILLVNSAGALRKLYCPFRVMVLANVADFRAGIYVWVEEVAAGERDELFYMVFSKPYLHTYFGIEATF